MTGKSSFHLLISLLTVVLTVFSGCNRNGSTPNNDLDWVNLPSGFHITVYAREIENARGMALGSDGTVFVGSSSAGNVYALRDTNNDFIADKKWTVAEGLSKPVGVAFKNGALYVSAVTRILRFPDIENHLDNPPQPATVTAQLPDESGHNWRYIAIGPDDKLYAGVGAPCNICESDSIFATIVRMNLDGSDLEIFASGIRNTVGFDWHPTTGELWFSDNGRDGMGDDVPPDELNYAPHAGVHFGFPYCHGGTIADPDFGAQRGCSEFTAPVQNLTPHAAALGIRFYTGEMFPPPYRNQIFIAEHGSWDRSSKVGYRITLVKLDGIQASEYEVFADGFEVDETVRGRPVDLLVLPDGSMLVSDDFGNTVYRIYYE